MGRKTMIVSYLLVFIALSLSFIGVVVVTQTASADGIIHVKEGSLFNHACDSTEWHFVITGIPEPNLAPIDITVQWANGAQEVVPLDGVQGNNADYTSFSNLESPVTDAWTTIFDGWDGQFNLSHGPCLDATPTPTDTVEPTSTFTATPTVTPTFTNTPTNTPTDTPTNTPTTDPKTPTPTGTQPTATMTSTPTYTYTPTPANTPTVPQPTYTQTTNPTQTATMTPKPPVPANASGNLEYPGKYIGYILMDNHIYKLYKGVNANDGSLMLPSSERGAAQYNNVIWVHRAWNTGWLNLKTGDSITVVMNGNIIRYKISSTKELPYGIYPNDDGIYYIATCYSNDAGQWAGVELFKLEVVYKP